MRLLVARIAAALALALTGPLGWIVGTAEAQEPPPVCPASDLDPTGLDQPEQELRRLRNDLGALCAVLRDGLGVAHDDAVSVEARTDDVLDAIAPMDGRLVGVRSDLSDLLDRLDSPVAVESGPQPLATDDDESRTTAEAAYEGIHADLWFLIGLATALLAGYALYRQVMPRA